MVVDRRGVGDPERLRRERRRPREEASVVCAVQRQRAGPLDSADEIGCDHDGGAAGAPGEVVEATLDDAAPVPWVEAGETPTM